MYIQFGHASNVGGAVQGVIPVQDAQGNMLGGGTPAGSPEQRQLRREVKSTQNGLGQLEQHFERMMEAVERNSGQIAALAEKQSSSEDTLVATLREQRRSGEGEGDGYFPSSELSTHLGRINDLLTRNSEHVENLAKRQLDSEQKLRTAIEDSNTRHRADYNLDMSQLSSHLDRIQSLMEAEVKQRKDSAKELLDHQSTVSQPVIDLSPLNDRLEMIHDSLEQNSALIKALLDEGTAATPFAEKQNPVPPQMDMSPLTAHLEKIHLAITQQSEHMQALVGFASGGSEAAEAGAEAVKENVSLAPLAEHLEQIYNAIEEGTKKLASKESPSMDIAPLTSHLEAIRLASEQNAANVKDLIDTNRSASESASSQHVNLKEHLQAMRAATESNADCMKALVDGQDKADVNQLKEHLLAMRTATESNADCMRVLVEAQEKAHTNDSAALIDLSPLTEHLQAMREGSERNAGQMKALFAAQEKALEKELDLKPLTQCLDAVQTSTDRSADQISAFIEAQKDADSKVLDLKPLTEHLDGIRTSTDRSADQISSFIEAQKNANSKVLDLKPLTEHLDGIRTSTDRSADQISALVEAQKNMGSKELDLKPLTDQLEAIRDISERNFEHYTDLVEAQNASREAFLSQSKLDFSPLAKHLQALHNATQQSAEQQRDLLQELLSAQKASPAPPSTDFTPLTDRLNSIHASLEKAGQRRDSSPGMGDSKFLMSALTSHLSKIQAVTEQNAQHVKSLREKQSASQDKMHIAVTQTAEQVAQLTARNLEMEVQLASRDRQVQDLMRGHSEMVGVMRELAMSLQASNKSACDHVVIPPPRKMGRKVVGFVYENPTPKDG